MSVLLHHIGHLLHQLRNRNGVFVLHAVGLSNALSSLYKNSEVRTHPTVGEPDVVRGTFNLANGALVIANRLYFLLRRQDNAISRCMQTDACTFILNGSFSSTGGHPFVQCTV